MRRRHSGAWLPGAGLPGAGLPGAGLPDFGESGLDCASAGRSLARYDLPWFNKGKLRGGISNAVFAWICSATPKEV